MFASLNKLKLVRLTGLCSILFLISSCGLFRHTTKNKDKKDDIASKQCKVIIQTALSYQGTPYKLGGSDKHGIDCSALVKIAYAAANIDLPRRSIEQFRVAKPVSINQVVPGDLIFFKFDKGGKNEIDHVGIVYDVSDRANIKFIHASTKKGVMVDELVKPYNTKAFVSCKRFLSLEHD